MSNTVLDITTEVVEPKQIKIDDEVYKLYTLNHLSDQREAEVTATFARVQRGVDRLIDATNQDKAEKAARVLQRLRVKLIGLMTDIPEDTIRGFKPGVQAKLVEVVRNEIEVDPEDEDDEDEAEASADREEEEEGAGGDGD